MRLLTTLTGRNHRDDLGPCVAGIMISLALVHIIAESFEVLDGVAGDYPVAAIFIL